MLLGCTNSGKTTLFKQLQYIHSDGFGDADKQKFRRPIWEQMIYELQEMIRVLTDDDNEFIVFDDVKERGDTKIDRELHKSVDFLLGIVDSNFEMSDEVAGHVRALWNDGAIQKVFKMRAKCAISDSTGLFNFVCVRVVE